MKIPYAIQSTRPPAPVRAHHILWAIVIPLAACGFAYLITLAAMCG